MRRKKLIEELGGSVAVGTIRYRDWNLIEREGDNYYSIWCKEGRWPNGEDSYLTDRHKNVKVYWKKDAPEETD